MDIKVRNARVENRVMSTRFVSKRRKLVCENSFRKHSYGEKKIGSTRFVSRPRNWFRERSWKSVLVAISGVSWSKVLTSLLKRSFFYTCETQKCLWKPFFTLFPEFSSVIFFFYAHLLIHFSLFSEPLFIRALYFFFRYQNHFHGHLFYFFHEQNLNEHQTPHQQKILIILTWKKSAITLG